MRGNNSVKIQFFHDFPGGPIVKTQHSQCRVHGLDPWPGTKIPCAKRCGQENYTHTHTHTHTHIYIYIIM